MSEPLTMSPGDAAPAEPPRREQLGASTVRGSLWTVGGYAAVQIVRLASSLILTRLLARELFGVMLVVNTVMTGIRLFSDVGIGPAIIANARGEAEPFLRTAWTTQVLRGFGIWLASVAIAGPVAHAYGRTDPAMLVLASLLPVAGFVAVIEGFRSTAVFRLQRQLRFREQSLLDILEIGITVVGMVAWALVQKSVWALVIPPLVGSLAATVVSHLFLRDRRDRFGWDRDCARELLRVGRWIFLSTALMFLASNADRLIFGKLTDAATLGVLAVAFTLAAMPTIAVMKVGQAVLFPAFARVAADATRFADVYRRARTMLLVIAAAVVSGMIAAGPFAVDALYKSDFAAAGWMLQLLAIGVWFQVVDTTNVAGLLARERPSWMAGGNLVKVVAMFALVPVGYAYHGFAGALVALGVADACRAVASTVGVSRLGVGRSTLVPDVAYPMFIAGVGLIGLWLARQASPLVAGWMPDGRLGVFVLNVVLAGLAAAIVLAAWGPVCAWQWKQTRRRAAE